MKTKIVLWGANEKDEKLLLAIELLEKDNQIGIHTFNEALATEEFYNKMMNIWRDGGQVPFPDGFESITRELKMAESVLPDNLKTDRTDIVNRAKTEWHFVVLSNKLSESLKDEVQEIKERIEGLTEFDNGIWEEMKGFWSKVQSQVREKNLFREHANDLRNSTNELFEKMKTLKKVMDSEFQTISETHLKSFTEKLDDIEDRITKGLGLQPIFNELKNLQSQFRDTDFTRRDRNKVWKKLDGAFKKVKAKKYGDKPGDASALSRLQRRYEGLLAAIGKMETSINRDKKEIDFQNKRINNTDGQLEAQLRQAKLAMIQERIKSKDEKLTEMLKTKTELESKIESEKVREEKRKENAEIKKEKKEVKAQIAADIKETQEKLEADSQKFEKAAADIKETKKVTTSSTVPEAPVTEEQSEVNEALAIPNNKEEPPKEANEEE
tara:strand:- start:1063 stop:2379 length:1317 start_codon:yes stop_codon:yes gene_type:complete